MLVSMSVRYPACGRTGVQAYPGTRVPVAAIFRSVATAVSAAPVASVVVDEGENGQCPP